MEAAAQLNVPAVGACLPAQCVLHGNMLPMKKKTKNTCDHTLRSSSSLDSPHRTHTDQAPMQHLWHTWPTRWLKAGSMRSQKRAPSFFELNCGGASVSCSRHHQRPSAPSYVDLQVVNGTHIMQGHGYSGATQALECVYRLYPSPSSCQSRGTVVREAQPLYDGQQLWRPTCSPESVMTRRFDHVIISTPWR